ncbi:unnamed protein product [Leptidea sinapis]|uniref:Major facilitator superfamily (MFS) profile domain-containing protein n=1 Tax=Leptidea sinapis TaxID=189913 RepID=A0A5E4QKN4_9NEOP|nr:unnamed protein product [Leptidea sinapis]
MALIEADPGDHRWVGMWWGGFLLGGLLLILVAIPFFSFPKVLVREKEKIRLVEKAAAASGSGAAKAPPKPASNIKDTGYGRDIKDIPVSMWRLLKNPVYVVTCLGACMELMIVSGFVVFLPKYLETQFSLGKSQASVFTGSIAIPGACIGIFMGGCLLKRLELRPKGAVQFVLISNIICLSCYALLFFLGCDNIKMAGTTIPYTNNTEVTVVPVATAGACNPPCTTIFPFLVLLFFMTFVVAITQMPLLMIVLRSVSEEERSFALGMQFVIFRLFGYIPAPIVFGNLIDSTCILWKQSCGENSGRLFEELPSADNASGIRSGITTGPSSSVTSPMDADTLQHSHNTKLQRTDSQYSQDSQTRPAGKNSRVLVASRHLRNDSKTIQLEPRARQHSLDEPERTKPVRSDSKHSRDAFPRSTSRDFTGHSRNSSRDFKVHSRGDSRDLSLEQLKHLALKSMESLDLTVLPLTKCVDEESKRLIESGGVLRHRRTSSRDLKPPETKHKRTSSHHITMEPNELSLQIQKGRSVDHLASSPLDPQV